MTMEGVVEFDHSFISSDRQGITFVWMKNHFPSHIASLSRSSYWK